MPGYFFEHVQLGVSLTRNSEMRPLYFIKGALTRNLKVAFQRAPHHPKGYFAAHYTR